MPIHLGRALVKLGLAVNDEPRDGALQLRRRAGCLDVKQGQVVGIRSGDYVVGTVPLVSADHDHGRNAGFLQTDDDLAQVIVGAQRSQGIERGYRRQDHLVAAARLEDGRQSAQGGHPAHAPLQAGPAGQDVGVRLEDQAQHLGDRDSTPTVSLLGRTGGR